MGSICYCIILPKPLVLLFQFIDRIKLVLSMALFYLGLFPPSETRSVLLSAPDFSSPPFLSIETPPSIKRRLPVVKFASFSKGREDQPLCAVCLVVLEDKHEVRELGNCSHAFHKGCIDKWVDMGQVTCPLCRANLLPKGREERGNTGYM